MPMEDIHYQIETKEDLIKIAFSLSGKGNFADVRSNHYLYILEKSIAPASIPVSGLCPRPWPGPGC